MFRFDFALSFSGADRKFARGIRTALKGAGFSVFFDEDYEHEMIGRDGSVYLRKIYGSESKYCVVLISENYDKSNWTNLEREIIQARELKGERGRLLPIKLDSYTPDWLPATRIYFDLQARTLEDLLMLLTRIIAVDNTEVPKIDNRAVKSSNVHIEGIWTIEERLSEGHMRRGNLTLQQKQGEVFGTASLVEEFFNREVSAEFSIHGNIEPEESIVRLTLAFEKTSSYTEQLNTAYSVDMLAGRFTGPDKIEGKCTDERGMSSTFTMVRKA